MAGSPYVVEYQGRFDLPMAPDDVWSAIGRVEFFESWWGWLRELRVEGPMLESGSVLHGIVVPPLPYRMRVRVHLDDCVPSRRIEASVHGDLEGRARLLLDPEAAGTRAEVAWTIEMTQRPMRVAARIAAPVLRWGHDRVVEATVVSFRRHLQELSTTAG